jgi:hypothetical protein
MLATLFLSLTVAIIATLQSLTFTRCYSLNCGRTSDTMEDIMPLPFFNSVPPLRGVPVFTGAPLCGVPPGGAPPGHFIFTTCDGRQQRQAVILS